MSETPTTQSTAQWRIDSWFPELPQKTRDLLRLFNDEFLRANKTLNLVSPKTVALSDAIHFADCIVGGRLVLNEIPAGSTIHDIGSGNGFPGIVMAILSPSHKFVLVDFDQKKVEFLLQAVRMLGIANCEVKLAQIDLLEAGSVKYGVARGFGTISKTILVARKCFAPSGALYHFKSEQWSNEVVEIPTQLCSVWSPALVSDYKLPVGSFKFSIVKTLKISK